MLIVLLISVASSFQAFATCTSRLPELSSALHEKLSQAEAYSPYVRSVTLLEAGSQLISEGLDCFARETLPIDVQRTVFEALCRFFRYRQDSFSVAAVLSHEVELSSTYVSASSRTDWLKFLSNTVHSLQEIVSLQRQEEERSLKENLPLFNQLKELSSSSMTLEEKTTVYDKLLVQYPRLELPILSTALSTSLVSKELTDKYVTRFRNSDLTKAAGWTLPYQPLIEAFIQQQSMQHLHPLFDLETTFMSSSLLPPLTTSLNEEAYPHLPESMNASISSNPETATESNIGKIPSPHERLLNHLEVLPHSDPKSFKDIVRKICLKQKKLSSEVWIREIRDHLPLESRKRFWAEAVSYYSLRDKNQKFLMVSLKEAIMDDPESSELKDRLQREELFSHEELLDESAFKVYEAFLSKQPNKGEEEHWIAMAKTLHKSAVHQTLSPNSELSSSVRKVIALRILLEYAPSEVYLNLASREAENLVRLNSEYLSVNADSTFRDNMRNCVRDFFKVRAEIEIRKKTPRNQNIFFQYLQDPVKYRSNRKHEKTRETFSEDHAVLLRDIDRAISSGTSGAQLETYAENLQDLLMITKTFPPAEDCLDIAERLAKYPYKNWTPFDSRAQMVTLTEILFRGLASREDRSTMSNLRDSLKNFPNSGSMDAVLEPYYKIIRRHFR